MASFDRKLGSKEKLVSDLTAVNPALVHASLLIGVKIKDSN